MSDVTDTPPPPPPPEAPLFVGHYIIPLGYADDAAKAFLKFQIARPAVLLPYAIIVLALVLLAWENSVHASSFSLPFMVFAIVFVTVILLSTALRARGLAKQLSNNAPAGGIYEVQLTDTTLTTLTPVASSTVRYTYYESVREQGNFLFLKVRGSRIRSIVPRALYSDEALAFLKSKLPA